MTSAENYPEHNRTSCRDDNPNINATAEGSTGCERCTAMLLDREARTRELLIDFKRLVGGISCAEAVHQTDKVQELAPSLLEDLLGVYGLYDAEDDDDE